jgi:hypothetical protein
MNRRKLYAPVLAAPVILLLCCCEKVIQPNKLPSQDPRPVVNALLYHDTLITAHVSMSRSILNDANYKVRDDAICELYINGQFAEKMQSSGNGFYAASKFGRSGNKYTMKVTVPGSPLVEGSATIPDSIAVRDVRAYDTLMSHFISVRDTFSTPGAQNMYLIRGKQKFTLNLQDNPSQKNYYSIQAGILVYDSLGHASDLIPCNLGQVNNDDPFGSDEPDLSSLDFNDEDAISGSIPLDLVFVTARTSEIRAYRYFLFIQVISLSQEYYQYKKTLTDQSGSAGNFFGEPVLVYSNMSNGMGIVGGARADYLLLRQGVLPQQ